MSVDNIQEMLRDFLFLIGEKLTKINLIHMCMFYIDLSYRLLLMRLSHLKLAEMSGRS
jgi:hypothetical protein